MGRPADPAAAPARRGAVASLRSELEYHHVDLAARDAPDDWPAQFVSTELHRVTALMDRRADAPRVTLIATATVRIGIAPPTLSPGPPAAAGRLRHHAE